MNPKTSHTSTTGVRRWSWNNNTGYEEEGKDENRRTSHGFVKMWDGCVKVCTN